MGSKMKEQKLYRVGKIISHTRLENLPLDILSELAKPKRVGKMKSNITREFLEKIGISLDR